MDPADPTENYPNHQPKNFSEYSRDYGHNAHYYRRMLHPRLKSTRNESIYVKIPAVSNDLVDEMLGKLFNKLEFRTSSYNNWLIK